MEKRSFSLQTCPVCKARKPQKQPEIGKPITSVGFLTRIQIDVVDMSSSPDEKYKWILYARDHFNTECSWAYPLSLKRR